MVTAPLIGQAPTISRVLPNHGPGAGGTQVTICGSNFTATPTVRFNIVNATGVTWISSTEIRATAPPGTEVVNVVVTNPDTSSATAVEAFRYFDVPPAVNTVTPASGGMTGGTVVTIGGANFRPNARVRFGPSLGGAEATMVNFVNSSVITAATPAQKPGPADVMVINPDQTAGTKLNGFTYTAARFFPLTPACRVINTFAGDAPALNGGATRTFSLANRCGGLLPATARALAANVTVTQSTWQGVLVLLVNPSDPIFASTLNYDAGQTVANGVPVLPLGSSATLSARVIQPLGTTVHLLVDITGYYQ